ncbi:MAG: PLP-dependent transferase [Planctomycetes bacterium]|nr:PLP-dependent transferase [Planctomycetota bacterium]
MSRTARARLVVDNTFATPALSRPLSHGADLVVHSTTKFLCGHADAMGGVVCAAGPLLARLRQYAKIHGSVSSPLDAWLTLRGVRTLALRVRTASANALALARMLARQAKVRAVHYPGLPGAGSHVRTVLRGGFGAMLAFDLRGFAQAARLVRALRGDVPLAPSLGDVATTISHPASSSHAGLSPAERRAAGIGDGLVRVSTGIEETRDILDDFQRALGRV